MSAWKRKHFFPCACLVVFIPDNGTPEECPAHVTEERKAIMKLKEALTIALAERDLPRLGRIVDQLRACGFTYADTLQFAQKVSPSLTRGDWEDLMQDIEALEAAS